MAKQLPQKPIKAPKGAEIKAATKGDLKFGQEFYKSPSKVYSNPKQEEEYRRERAQGRKSNIDYRADTGRTQMGSSDKVNRAMNAVSKNKVKMK